MRTHSLATHAAAVHAVGAHTNTWEVRLPFWLSDAVAPSSHSAPVWGCCPDAHAPYVYPSLMEVV